MTPEKVDLQCSDTVSGGTLLHNTILDTDHDIGLVISPRRPDQTTVIITQLNVQQLKIYLNVLLLYSSDFFQCYSGFFKKPE